MAKCTKNIATRPAPSPDCFQIEMSKDEAELLVVLLGGLNKTEAEKLVKNAYTHNLSMVAVKERAVKQFAGNNPTTSLFEALDKVMEYSQNGVEYKTSFNNVLRNPYDYFPMYLDNF